MIKIREESMNLDKNRIFYLDLARCFAIMAVILIHINEGISYSEVYSGAVRISVSSWFCQNSIHIIGRLGVPWIVNT